jgi:hypothetical protein
MARRELRDKQYTIYAKSHADLVRWRALAASQSSSLNNWILTMIERGVDGPVFTTANADEINDLRKQITDLTKRNEDLTARLELTQGMPREEPQLDKDVVDLLRSGGAWSAMKIYKEFLLTWMDETSKMIVRDTKRAESISRTLEQLEWLGLVEIDESGGWKWI